MPCHQKGVHKHDGAAVELLAALRDVRVESWNLAVKVLSSKCVGTAKALVLDALAQDVLDVLVLVRRRPALGAQEDVARTLLVRQRGQVLRE